MILKDKNSSGYHRTYRPSVVFSYGSRGWCGKDITSYFECSSLSWQDAVSIPVFRPLAACYIYSSNQKISLGWYVSRHFVQLPFIQWMSQIYLLCAEMPAKPALAKTSLSWTLSCHMIPSSWRRCCKWKAPSLYNFQSSDISNLGPTSKTMICLSKASVSSTLGSKHKSLVVIPFRPL